MPVRVDDHAARIRGRMTALRNILVSILGFLIAWQGIVWIGDLKPFILPGPIRVAEAIIGVEA